MCQIPSTSAFFIPSGSFQPFRSKLPLRSREESNQLCVSICSMDGEEEEERPNYTHISLPPCQVVQEKVKRKSGFEDFQNKSLLIYGFCFKLADKEKKFYRIWKGEKNLRLFKIISLEAVERKGSKKCDFSFSDYLMLYCWDKVRLFTNKDIKIT